MLWLVATFLTDGDGYYHFDDLMTVEAEAEEQAKAEADKLLNLDPHDTAGKLNLKLWPMAQVAVSGWIRKAWLEEDIV